ncbi:hypothetical protein BDK51DRAFT_26180 [Blyttiomyces helicus]|uniref:Uncharacterized protein n=1 Tax=Blyttiomyces helicus TaxID=388810 RepID=A0A4P9VXB6_9FUNG|nr:hypothetical protein BDK51DRAFT_26180 [Blyttiomyces helicus]|eukprot:RKO82930.1 hypothetical protein BDK51DRAFT_26180 [Blyttiomyces helicus]
MWINIHVAVGAEGDAQTFGDTYPRKRRGCAEKSCEFFWRRLNIRPDAVEHFSLRGRPPKKANIGLSEVRGWFTKENRSSAEQRRVLPQRRNVDNGLRGRITGVHPSAPPLQLSCYSYFSTVDAGVPKAPTQSTEWIIDRRSITTAENYSESESRAAPPGDDVEAQGEGRLRGARGGAAAHMEIHYWQLSVAQTLVGIKPTPFLESKVECAGITAIGYLSTELGDFRLNRS